MFTYRTQGVCAQAINFDVVDGLVKDVTFQGGCSGNTQGVAALVEGRPAEEVIGLLKGIDCRGRGTSCPDQLACALELALEAQENQQ